jgi:hypothetical protein
VSLIDLFLNQQGESERIRELSGRIAARSEDKKIDAALRRTRADVGFLALALLAAIRLLEEKGVFSEAELFNRIARLDKADGLMDGRIDPGLLRKALGLRSKARRVRHRSRGPGAGKVHKVPEARLVEPGGKPQPEPDSARAAGRRAQARSKTLAWSEAQTPAAPVQPAAGAPAPDARAPDAESVLDAPVPEPTELSAPGLEIPDTSMDPSKLREISFDDYFGGGEQQ